VTPVVPRAPCWIKAQLCHVLVRDESAVTTVMWAG
jgi:hypothetical protein